MSQLVDASEIRELAAGIERQQVMDIVRGATFVGTLLLGWISLHPFESLGDMQIGDVGTGNELATYAVFGALSVLTVALAMRNDARGLATLLSPAFVLFGAWLLVTVVLSFDPGTSIKRLSLDDLRCRGDRRPDAAAEVAAGIDATARWVWCETVRGSMQGCDACSVSRCHTKRIDALWLEFHSGANLSHMLG